MAYEMVNRVVVVGRLTHDPELRALASGSSVCSLRLACNGSRRTADGSYEERPNYFDVSVFGALGENVDRHMERGRLVAIDGRLEWREWDGEHGRRQAVSIVADRVMFLDRPAGDGEEEGAGDPELASVGTDDGAAAF
jgi:single-strand DNA-binding protein